VDVRKTEYDIFGTALDIPKIKYGDICTAVDAHIPNVEALVAA
jgi:hypothetical protein